MFRRLVLILLFTLPIAGLANNCIQEYRKEIAKLDSERERYYFDSCLRLAGKTERPDLPLLASENLSGDDGYLFIEIMGSAFKRHGYIYFFQDKTIRVDVGDGTERKVSDDDISGIVSNFFRQIKSGRVGHYISKGLEDGNCYFINAKYNDQRRVFLVYSSQLDETMDPAGMFIRDILKVVENNVWSSGRREIGEETLK